MVLGEQRLGRATFAVGFLACTACACAASRGDERIVEDARDHLRRADREGGLARIAQLSDPYLGNLLLSELAREEGLDLCGAIRDPRLAEQCSSTTRRPHLRGPDAGRGDVDRRYPVRPVPPGWPCADVTGSLRDECLLDAARNARGGTEGIPACERVAKADARGKCLSDLAGALARMGSREEGVAVCPGIESGRWRDECYFLVAEAQAGDPASAFALCRQAGAFADECLAAVSKVAPETSTP